MMKPHIGPREVVYQNPYQLIYRVSVTSRFSSKDIFVLECGSRVGVVVMRGRNVLLVRQYRLLVQDMAWEIPGGKVEAGESLQSAAQREALEEGGVMCRAVEPLLYFHPGLDTCDNPTFMFLAEGPEDSVEGRSDDGEVSERLWVHLDECLQMIFLGKIVDSLTVAALMAVYIRLQTPELARLRPFLPSLSKPDVT